MKIKITAIVPVAEEQRPIINEIYEVVRIDATLSRDKVFFVIVNGNETGVFENRECEIVKE